MNKLFMTITEKDVGRKIKYLVRGDLGVSYQQFNSLKVREGIIVNGEIVHANYELKLGDEVEINLFDRESETVPFDYKPVNIAYEDDDIIIVDKIAPLSSQYSHKQTELALENRLAARYGQDYVFRPLNRLDKGTSGLMCVAKHSHACQLLQKQLHTGEFVREYFAIVVGSVIGKGVINLPIAKIEDATVKRHIDVKNGKECVTHWKSVLQTDEYTLLRLSLETGRTHQIRVHMAAIGHPVVGDFLYGTEIPELPSRFALHSAYIRLVHPLTGKIVEVESPLPDELSNLLK